MIDKLIAYSIKNKLIIGLFTLGLCLWGIYSLKQLPIDAVPDITNNQVQVITSSPSLAAEEVERLITFPVEVTMASIPKIEEIRSFSRFGLSVVTIVFKENVDVYWARQQVNERLSQAEAEIPSGIGKPNMAPVTTGLGEIYQYVIAAEEGYEDRYPPTELRSIQDWIIKRQLLGTPGVADVSSFGGYLKQYEIALDPDRLKAMNVSFSEIFTALENNNENTGGAYIEKNKNAYFIRSEGLVTSLKDIEQIRIKNNANGAPVLIRDIAKVQIGHAVRYGATTKNGEGEVVSAIVMMLKGENSDDVIENVKSRMAEIQKTLPEGVTIAPFLDRSKLVDTAIGTVTKNLAEGALIVIFILLLLLGNFRAGLITASVIPLALLFAFSMMHLFGVSGNLMSLGAIDFGLIVDGAVIIVEATTHHISKIKRKRRLSQLEMDEEVYLSATKIRKSAAFGEIIILIVYLPILALVGTEGKMFRPMAQTVAFAILGAFILSLTYVPMVSALFLSKNVEHKRNISDRIMDAIRKVYDPIIHWAMNTKRLIIAGTTLLFIVAMVVFSRLGGEFIPTLEEGDFAVETRVITGSSLEATIAATTAAEKILLAQFPEVEQVVSKIGSGEIPTDPMPIEAADMMIILKNKKEWTSAKTREELANKMSEALEELPGVNFGFQQPIQMRFNELMTGVRQDVAIKIYGEDLDVLSTYAQQIGALVNNVEGAEDVYIEEVTGVPQIVINYKRDQLAKYGLDISDVNHAIESAFAGTSAGTVYENERRFDLTIRLDKAFRNDLSNVRNLYISRSDGHQIPLYQVATVEIKDGVYQIQRDDTHRRILVAFNVRNRDVESVVKEMQDKIEESIVFAPGYSAQYGGQFENLVQARERLMVAVPLALLLIFILLYFTFNSLTQSVMIFTAIPLSAIGGILALYFRDMPFSISAGVGFIALFGVAVLNGIVLIGEFNYLKKEGVTDVLQRIYEGTATRLRPVILTASVASLGFLPMAISASSGAEVQKPLATVVIGGLISATFLTLILLPILYYFVETGWKKKRRNSPVLLLVLGLGFTTLLPAQDKGAYTLNEIIALGLENNPGIKVSAYQIEKDIADKKGSLSLNKTNVGLEYGQTNSIYKNDSRVSVSQSFAFPTVYSSKNSLAKDKIQASTYRNESDKDALVWNIKSVYYQLLLNTNKQQLLLRQDSLYSDFANAAKVRYETGESNALEKANADAQLAEVKIQIEELKSTINMLHSDMMVLLNLEEPIAIKEEPLRVLPSPALVDSVATNPALQYYEQQIDIANGQYKVEKAKTLPEFTLGYFNQSFNGPGNTLDGGTKTYTSSDRFSGIQFGVAIPLFSLKSDISRTKMAKINRSEKEQAYAAYQNELKGTYRNLIEKQKQNQRILSFYEAQALPQANLIATQVQKSYKAGEIGYLEYIIGMNNALDIQTKHLDYINDFNQSTIELEYVLGQSHKNF